MRGLLRGLDRHFFAPASLTELAIVRIIVVGSQLLFFFPSLEVQLRLAAADATTFEPIPALKIMLLPLGGWGIRPDPTLLHAIWLAAIVAGVSAVVGLYTRPGLLVFAAANTTLVAHKYSYQDYHHPEGLMMLALWLLALSPAGAALSVDSLRERIRGSVRFMQFRSRTWADDLSPWARWPLRLMQWLFVLAYLSAGLSKLSNGGLDWFNGYTMSYYFLQDGLRNDIPLALYLHEQVALATMMSIVTVLFELTFALAILVPVLVWPYVLTGTLLHAGIFFTLGAPFFQFIALYTVFIESLRRPLARFRREPMVTEPWTVIYDGLCPLCIRSMVVLDAFDLRRRLRFVDLEREWPAATALAPQITPAEARHAMHVVGPNGTVYRGYFAFRELARVLPGMWPLLPLFHAPFADSLGPGIYSLVAENRGRAVCRAETCTTA